jgi:hypothetical protein
VLSLKKIIAPNLQNLVDVYLGHRAIVEPMENNDPNVYQFQVVDAARRTGQRISEDAAVFGHGYYSSVMGEVKLIAPLTNYDVRELAYELKRFYRKERNGNESIVDAQGKVLITFIKMGSKEKLGFDERDQRYLWAPVRRFQDLGRYGYGPLKSLRMAWKRPDVFFPRVYIPLTRKQFNGLIPERNRSELWSILSFLIPPVLIEDSDHGAVLFNAKNGKPKHTVFDGHKIEVMTGGEGLFPEKFFPYPIETKELRPCTGVAVRAYKKGEAYNGLIHIFNKLNNTEPLQDQLSFVHQRLLAEGFTNITYVIVYNRNSYQGTPQAIEGQIRANPLFHGVRFKFIPRNLPIQEGDTLGVQHKAEVEMRVDHLGGAISTRPDWFQEPPTPIIFKWNDIDTAMTVANAAMRGHGAAMSSPIQVSDILPAGANPDSPLAVAGIVTDLDHTAAENSSAPLQGANLQEIVEALISGKFVLMISGSPYADTTMGSLGPVDTRANAIRRRVVDVVRAELKRRGQIERMKNLIIRYISGRGRVTFDEAGHDTIEEPDEARMDPAIELKIARGLVLAFVQLYFSQAHDLADKLKEINSAENLHDLQDTWRSFMRHLNLEKPPSIGVWGSELVLDTWPQHWASQQQKPPDGTAVLRQAQNIWHQEGLQLPADQYFLSSGEEFAKVSLGTKAGIIRQELYHLAPNGLVLGLGDATNDNFLFELTAQTLKVPYLPVYLGKTLDMERYSHVYVAHGPSGEDGLKSSGFAPRVRQVLEAEKNGLTYRGLIEEINGQRDEVITDLAMGGINKDKETERIQKGGIDLNSANLTLHIKRDGQGVALPLSKQDLAQLAGIQGLDPVILSIQPASQTALFSQLAVQS